MALWLVSDVIAVPLAEGSSERTGDRPGAFTSLVAHVVYGIATAIVAHMTHVWRAVDRSSRHRDAVRVARDRGVADECLHAAVRARSGGGCVQSPAARVLAGAACRRTTLSIEGLRVGGGSAKLVFTRDAHGRASLDDVETKGPLNVITG